METTVAAQVADVIQRPSELTVFGWYMAGVGLRVAWRWLGWVGDSRPERSSPTVFWARTMRRAIVSTVLAFVWTQSFVGELARWMGFEQAAAALSKVGVTLLSSMAAGFFLEWLVAGKILTWFQSHKKEG